MAYSLMERQIESTLYDMFGDKAVRLMGVVNKMAAKQGGESTIENYQLLGKRALIVAGVAVGVVYVTVSAVGFVMARRSEERRVERVVRRVLEEERAEAEAEK